MSQILILQDWIRNQKQQDLQLSLIQESNQCQM